MFSKNRQKCKHTSGGVALLVKNEMKNSVTLLDTECENVVLCRIDASILGKPVILGSVYIPPENSRYSKIDIFDDIEQEITEANRASHDIVLAGDVNARTGMIIENLHDSLDIFNENQKDICDRKSEDCVINNYGHRLIELCSNLNIIIINGRTGTDSGKVTCKNASLVDYFICSPSLLNQVVSFKVDTFDPMFSDVHCPITCSCKPHWATNPPETTSQPQYNNNNKAIDLMANRAPKRPRWYQTRKSNLCHF